MKIDFGPLKALLSDTSITEIMVNSPQQVFVEHCGVLIETDQRFTDERELWELIYAILHLENKDKNQALSFDGTLPNGSRYNIVLPPMTPKYPSLTIRKFSNQRPSLKTLVGLNSLSEKAATFLSHAVKGRLNIIVSGGAGSGKTSMLQALTFEIPDNERIVTIEDVCELKLSQKNWVQLMPTKTEAHHVTPRDCLVNSLRMRPDRILVGECRKDETFEMLQAMNTGHEGSMTTLHANSPNECLLRLENLLHMAKFDIPLKALRQQIATSIHLVVQLKRQPDGQRVVSEIMEISGMEGDVITRGTIFARDGKGELTPTGYIPRHLKALENRGFKLPTGYFDSKAK